MNQRAPVIELAAKPCLVRVWRAAFSFPAALAAVLVVLTVLTARSRFNDPDLWWHLKTGEIIWNTRSIPATDLLSFTTNSHAWTAHEWLSQVAIYGSWKGGGYTGLMLWLCVFASLLLIAEYVLCSLYSGNAKVAFLGALLTWLFATIGFAIRPHILGFLLLILELLVVHLGRSRDARWFLLLPPLFALWVNCHGSFILGLMVLAVILFCSCFELRKGSLVSHRWETPRRRMLALAFALSIVAVFVNPVGLSQVVYPLQAMFDPRMRLDAVTEWQGLAFDGGRALAALGVVGVIFLVTLVRRTELRLDELLLLALGFGIAVLHQRMLLVFGVLGSPVLCRLLANAWSPYQPARDHMAPNAILMLISLCIVGLAFPTSNQLRLLVKQANPEKAVEFIRHAGLSGRMLNEYAYGGYLIWTLPEHKVFIDGRSDVYAWTGVLDEYGAWATLQTDPTLLLDKYRIEFCLISQSAPMSHVLQYLPGWKRLYSDELSIIFARSNGTKWNSRALTMAARTPPAS